MAIPKKRNKIKIVERKVFSNPPLSPISSLPSSSEPIGIALRDAREGELVPIRLTSLGVLGGTVNEKVNLREGVKMGDVVCLDENLEVKACDSNLLDSYSKKDEIEKKVQVDNDVIMQILQAICSDLIYKDVVSFEYNKKANAWDILLREKADRKTVEKSKIIKQVDILGRKKIPPEQSFRRDRVIKKRIDELSSSLSVPEQESYIKRSRSRRRRRNRKKTEE